MPRLAMRPFEIARIAIIWPSEDEGVCRPTAVLTASKSEQCPTVKIFELEPFSSESHQPENRRRQVKHCRIGDRDPSAAREDPRHEGGIDQVRAAPFLQVVFYQLFRRGTQRSLP